ncbi:Chemotaxis protein CheC -- inhibitor of MCP methylation [hydrothermal vent metagenome]|uniref:Chemotaxis protein CheC -- inhibitor of MCP methylation n=1 Tax=hydrothermal vent metagenome TaxID=652676 RepID=A0A3B0YNG7_9ZZZZ
MPTQILICDDSSFACKQLARSLPQDWDASISFAANGKEGLEAVRAGKAELLFLDLNMPVMDGYQVLKAIRKDDLPSMVIVVSGDIQPEAHTRVMSMGALAFVEKPVDPELIGTILTEYGIEIKSASRKQEVDITVEHSDCYQEVANVAMGRAGDLLARLLGAFVRLPVPEVSMLTAPDLSELLTNVDEDDAITAVCQGFIGAGIAGEALLVFNKSSAQDIADLFKYEGTLDEHVELELLMDISGILIAACLNGIADQLDISFSQGQPVILGGDEKIGKTIEKNVSLWNEILVIKIEYAIENKNIHCDLFLLFTEDSIPALNERVSYISI